MITVDGGTLNLVNGTLTATGSGSDGMYGVYVLNGGTAIFENPTITSHFAAIGTNNTTAPATITVNGGTYTANAVPTDNEWWSYFCAPIYAASSGTYNINGGTFNGYYGISSRYANVEQTVYLGGVTFNASSDIQVFVDSKTGSAGEEQREIRSTSNELTLPAGYAWAKDGDGYIVAEAVAQVGNDYYASLEDAIAAAQEGETVKLLADITADLDSVVDPTAGVYNIDKSISIDGNGHSITANGTNSVHIFNVLGGTVSIKNIVLDGSGAAKSGVHAFVGTNVTLTNVESKNCMAGIIVNGAKVTAIDLKTSGNAWGGVNVDARDGNDAEFTIGGASVLTETYSIYTDNASAANVAVTINGGSYQKVGVIAGGNTAITISDGIFDEVGVNTEGGASGTIAVSGGSYKTYVVPENVVEGKLCTTVPDAEGYYHIVDAVKVTFKANGGNFGMGENDEPITEREVLVPKGEAIPAEEVKDPSRENYTFTGWNYQIPATITEELTLTALWASTVWQLKLPYTSGTLTETGAFFENLTLAFSPANPSIGRMIDAYWIGYKFIAPDAVTADNIANTTYSNDGGETWKSFANAKDGQEEDGRYYMQAWVPLTVDSVMALVDAQQTAKWTYKFAWDGNQDNAQTFVIEVSPENIVLNMNDETDPQIRVENWEIIDLNKTFHVVFDLNEGIADGAEDGKIVVDARFGTSIDSIAPEVTRENYEFKGWENMPDNSKVPANDLELVASWKGEERLVVYSDGLGHVLMKANVPYGDPMPTYTFPTDEEGNTVYPTREGYRLDPNELWAPAPAETVTDDVVYHLNWIKIWTLHFDLNGNGSANISDIVADDGVEVSFAYKVGGLSKVYKLNDTDEYQFLGWDSNPNVSHNKVAYPLYSNLATDWNSGTDTNRIVMNGDVTLYAIWGPKYVLHAKHNDGTENELNSNDAKPGTYANLMIGTRPTRSGYTLLGYSLNKNANVPDPGLEAGSTTRRVYYYLTADTTVYAIWQGKEYTVKYNLNGATGTQPDDYVYTAGEATDLVLPELGDIVKEGRIFLGWYDGSAFSDIAVGKEPTAAQLAKIYQPGQVFPAESLNRNITFTAAWKVMAITVNYDLNGHMTSSGAISANKSDTFGYGVAKAFATQAATYEGRKEGFSYPDNKDYTGSAAWFDAKTGTYYRAGVTKYTLTGENTTLNEDGTYSLDLIVAWKYTPVTFYGEDDEVIDRLFVQRTNSGNSAANFQVTMSPVTAIEGPTKEGYTFLGWASDKNATEAEYAAGDEISVISSTKLYPIYQINQYTVTFEANGGEELESQRVDYNTAITLPSTTKDNAVLIGWTVGENTYGVGDEYTVTADVTFTAVWANTVWTLELPYTTGTLTDDGAFFENLTLAFSPADPSIGRMIDAYWIGYKFIAPDAVTADNIANTTYSNDGGETWKSFINAKDGQEADGRYFMQAWVPLTVESVTALVDAQQTAKWTYKFAWDGNQDNAQTFVIEVSPENIILNKDPETDPEIKVVDWEIVDKNEYFDVTFDSDGGSAVETQNVRYNAKAAEPTEPKKEGFTFLGWFVGETKFDFDAPIKADVELKAKWATSVYKITFDLNNGEANVVFTDLEHGSVTPKIPAPTKEGSTFNGWEPAVAATVTDNAVYVATWRGEDKVIIYSDGLGNVLEKYTVKVDDPTPSFAGTLPAKDSRDTDEKSYTYYDNDLWTPAVADTVTKDVVYSLKWVELFTVTFDPDNGDESWNVIIGEGGLLTRPENDPEKEDYDFAGWYVGDSLFDFDSPVYSAMTLKAKWTLKLPEIIKHPESVSADIGESVTFSVEAKGIDLSYQWFFRASEKEEWQEVSAPDGNASSYTFVAEAAQYGSQYRCEVSNSSGSVYSDTATLKINMAKPKIITQPLSLTVITGETATFKVVASGELLTYQWYMREAGGTLKPLQAVSAKKDTFKVVTKLAHDGRQYCCKVSNPAGNTYTVTVTLHVIDAKPKIVTQPSSFDVKAGTTVTFHVEATGTNLKYQWYMREAGGELKPLSAVSAKTDTLKVVTKKSHDGRQYCCKVWNSAGSTYTKTVTLNVS